MPLMARLMNSMNSATAACERASETDHVRLLSSGYATGPSSGDYNNKLKVMVVSVMAVILIFGGCSNRNGNALVMEVLMIHKND